MSETKSPSSSAAPALAAPAASATMPLNEFCMALSGRDRRVELIAAFAHLERAAGNLNDTSAAYAERFAAVGARPSR